MSQGQSYPVNFLRQDNFFIDPITNNLNPNNPAYPYAGTFAALLLALGYNVRTKAKTDYYVDPVAGNDAAAGAIGSPWKTLLHAMAVITTLLDFVGQTVTLHLVNNATENLKVTPWVGGGGLVFDAAAHSIAYAGVQTIDGAILISGGALPGGFTYQNVSLSTTAGAAATNALLQVFAPATVVQGAGVTLGSSADSQIKVNGGGQLVELLNSFTVSGGGAIMLQADGGGFITTAAQNITITVSANIVYSLSTARCQHASNMFLGRGDGANPFALGGHTVTGQRYFVDTAGSINTGGGGANFIPGTIAGAAPPPGTYS